MSYGKFKNVIRNIMNRYKMFDILLFNKLHLWILQRIRNQFSFNKNLIEYYLFIISQLIVLINLMIN